MNQVPLPDGPALRGRLACGGHQAMIRGFQRNGRLPEHRGEALKMIFKALLKSVGLGRRKQLQAFQALGLAMELASRNSLTRQEAELAMSARLDLASAEATSLFGQVVSLLLCTPEGLCFPHHSLGEYLAALALRKTRLSLILDYLFLPGTRIPNTSWKSAIVFLAEVHVSVRRYFAAHHPELALQSAFRTLTVAEKAAIGQSLYKRLCERGEPLFRHPEISASPLAQCLKASCLNQLESDARTATDPIVASNAFLLLGEANQQSALPLATSTALDGKVDLLVRQAAFHAVGRLGTAALGAMRRLRGLDTIAGMRDFQILLVHFIVTVARLARPGDRILFWTTIDLETKLLDFQHYFNAHRTHAGLHGRLPEPSVDGSASPIDFDSYTWQRHCRGLYQSPNAA